MIASPEMEPRLGAGGVPVERASLNNLPTGWEVIFQRRGVWLNKIYLELWGALRANLDLPGVLGTDCL